MMRLVCAGVLGALLVAGSGEADAEESFVRSQGARASFYWDVGMSIGAHPILGAKWDSALPLSVDFKVSVGMWVRQRFAVFSQVGIMPRLVMKDAGLAAQASDIEERLRYIPIRIGGKLNIWPTTDWVQLNLVGAGSVAIGEHELIVGAGFADPFVSFGVGAGAELNLIKFKRMGINLSAMYYVQPVDLGEDMGFRAEGLTDIGGIEVLFSYMGFFGGPS